MLFYDNHLPVNLGVSAEEISDSRQLLKLVNRKLDVTSTTSTRLIDYINKSKRYNPPVNVNVATRLGHVKGYFIYPYQEEMKNSKIKLFNNDRGFQKLIDSFQSKGTLESYSKNVFNQIKNLPMVMIMLYASLGSVLLREFGLQPFIVEISGSTSTGKTFTLNLVSSVWGTRDLITTWGSTKNSIEAMASFLNSFPMFKDDTRNTNPKFVANATYNFSSGESKSRSNINLTLNAKKEWRNIMLSTGEASISNMANEKAGVSARVITLQDQPYPDNFDFTTLDKAFRENYGTLGIAFIKQYESKQEAYKSAFDSYQRYFNRKGSNEIMQRLGRAFALLQITGEILNDIDGFEHDHFKIIEQAYDSMVRNNKTIDKPKQLLEELLQYLDANRNNIAGDGYSSVKNGDIKAIYKHNYLCILGQTVHEKLGHEMQTITGQWDKKGYLITSKDRIQKEVRFNSQKNRGYAIKNEIVKELGFDFSNSHNPYN
ncbi:pathogenicity island protein [Staphylococcus aureus]|nr:pathogenicity island protein [Staphylococcus aureus]